MQILFQSPNILARAFVRDTGVLVIGVSFHGVETPTKGQLALLDERFAFSFSFVDVACVMRFPLPIAEVHKAIPAVAAFARDYPRVVMFGSSVGGFAALNMAPFFGADSAVAASPLFSGDPAKMPGETRWQALRQGASFELDTMAASLKTLRHVYLLYDPFSPDVPHVDAIEREARAVTRLAVPFGGHPAFSVLNQGGTLGGLIEAMVADRLERSAFRDALRQGRRNSPIFLKNLAKVLPERRDALRVQLLEMAYALDDATETQLLMLPPLVRLGRMKDVHALTRSVVEFEAAQVAQKRALRERYAALKDEVEELRNKVRKLKGRG